MLERIMKAYREGGVRCFLKRTKMFIHERVYLYKFFWYEKDLLEVLDPICPKLAVDVDMGSLYEVIEWIKQKIYNGKPYTSEELENKIAIQNKHIFPSLKLNGEIICYSKIGCNNIYIKNFKKEFCFQKKVALVCAFYTNPKYRRLNLASFLLIETMRFLKTRGFNKIACHIRTSNIASISVFNKSGFKKVGSSWQLKCFNLNIFSRPPAVIFESY